MGRQLFLLLFFIAFSLLAANGYAQVYDLVVLDNESGIAGIEVNDIGEDADGYLWAATNAGVSRFDGKNFVNYGRNQGLAENNCTAILCDSKNRIWIGHQTAGISVITRDSVLHFSENNGVVNNEVHDIFEDAQGKIWVATFGGVSIFDGENWTTLTTEDGLASNYAQAISQDSEGKIWVGTFGGGLSVIDNGNIGTRHMGNGLVNNHVTSLLSHDNRMLIGTLGGLSTWSEHGFKSISATDGLSNSQVNDVAVGENGDIWLATYNGADRIRNGKLLRLTEENGLPHNEILTVFIDAGGNTWFGTKKGLVRVRNLAFSHFFSSPELDIEPTFFYRDSKAKLWAANENGGVLRFDGTRFVKAFDDPDINDHQISSIAEDGRGNLWFGTMDFGGLFQFDGKRFYIYSDEFGLADNNINCLLQDAEGNLLIGTANGLSEYDGDGFRLVFGSDDEASANITCMQATADGTVYLGTSSGKVLSLKDGMVEDRLNVDFESAVVDMAVGPMGLAIATFADGLYLYADGKVRALDHGYGLRSLAARSVAFLGDDLFLGSVNNLQRIRAVGDSISVTEFNREDGLMGAVCKRGAMLAEDNSLWIGTGKGIARYVPSEQLPDVKTPRLLFTDLQLFYKNVDWKTMADEVLANGLPVDLKLQYGQNSLQFFFRSIYHREPNGIRFRWILEGYETTWNPPSNTDYVSYPNLPPGNYTFRVVACTPENVCSEPLEFKFRIAPPFWQTLWFYAVSAVALLIITFIYIKIRERKLKADKRFLETTVKERTKELWEQKEIVEEQNRHITESIDYAKNIQMAVLPSAEDMADAFDGHFVFYRPKDIVGGDFYWIFADGDISWAAAVDCTGHGVAGAFMSMIGTDLLNQIIIEKKVDDPASVLSEMDKGIKLAFAQSAKQFETDQGMDVALVRIDRKAKVLQFSGAQRPLYLLQDGELIEIEGNKLSISCAEQRREEEFITHTRPILSNTMAFVFSDGFVDQFGGPHGKKFMIRSVRTLLKELGHLSIDEQAAHVTNAFDEWKGELEQIDDVMLLGIRL